MYIKCTDIRFIMFKVDEKIIFIQLLCYVLTAYHRFTIHG